MNSVFQYRQLAQLWQALKTMGNTDDAFNYLDHYFKHDTTIEGTLAHNQMRTYYLIGYTTGERRLTVTFTLSIIPTTTAVAVTVAHTAINLTPDTFFSALQSVEQFMSLFY